MPRKIQDIQPHKKTAGSIPVQVPSVKPAFKKKVLKDTRTNEFEKKSLNKKKGRRGFWFFLIFLIIVLVALALLPIWQKAVITITPKIKQFSFVQEPFTASRHATVDNLNFEIMSLPGSEMMPVEQADEASVDSKATGTVTLYNNYSAQVESLAPNTRLLGTNQKIYHIEKSVKIPGKQGNIPGSISVSIIADVVGSDFNSDPQDFTFPGYNNSPKTEKIYARSSTQISGGNSGTEYILKPEDAIKLQSIVIPRLEKTLRDRAQAQLPKNYILYPDAAVFVPDKSQTVIKDAEQKYLEQKGTLYAVLFNEERLNAEISNKEGVKAELGDYIPNLNSLIFSFTEPLQPDPLIKQNISFTLSGTSQIIWKNDIDSIRYDLLNHAIKDIPAILERHPELSDIKVKMRPVWKKTIPQNVENVEIQQASI